MAGLNQPPPTTEPAPAHTVTVLVVTHPSTAAVRSNLQALLTGAGFPGQITSNDVLTGPEHDLATQESTASGSER